MLFFFFFFPQPHGLTSQMLKCDIMKRQLLELWEEKWKHGTYTKSLVSNSISSQKEEKRGKKRQSI